MTVSYRDRCHRPYLWNLIEFLVIFAHLPYNNAQDTPDLGPYHYLGCYSARTDLLKDAVFFARNAQTCTDYCEKLNIRYAVLSGDKCFCDNVAIDTEKLDPKFCNMRCSGNKSQYCGGIESHSYYSTQYDGPPENIRVSNSSEDSILITWDPPNKEDQVSMFVIKSIILHSYATYPLFQHKYIVQSTEDRFEMTDLHPGTKYNISVSAMCGDHVCGIHYLLGITEIGIPNPAPMEPVILNRTDTTILIQIQPYVNNNGPVSKCRVIVQRLDSSLTQPFDEELLGGYERAQEDGTFYYIASEMEYLNTTQSFVVGDNQTYGGYWNPPLEKGSHIHISLGMVSTLNEITKVRYAIASHEQDEPTDFQYADFEPGEESILALTVVCVIFAVLFVLSVVIYLYLKRETRRLQRLPSDTHELTLQGPMVEMENNGYVADETRKGSFKEQLNALIENVDSSQRLPRNAIRMNVDEVIADGRFGEVITGKLYASAEAYDCQVHILSDDMNHETQTQFLKDFENIIRLMPNDKFLHFYGITASVDWFYLIFENNKTTLKRRLIESRVPPNTPNSTFATVSEECVLLWVYEVAMAMEYLEVNKVVHKHLCSYSVYVTNVNKVKVSLFGPIPYAEDGKKVDISRWLAPEVLRFQNNSHKSDIWSFACLAWECCTLGATPYANITSQDLLPRIKNGLRPEQPAFVFSDLYQLFLNCWQLEPSDRPDFEDVAFNVRQILTSPPHALSFSRNDQSVLPYYLPLLEMHN